MPTTRLVALSSRLAGLIEGDLSGYRRAVGENGRVLFLPDDDGPVFDVVSRVERRFLGRTEIAVFGVDLDVPFADEGKIGLRHTGRLTRTGVSATPVVGGETTRNLASTLTSDPLFAGVMQPLDFTRFEIMLSRDGCRVEIELMGASHVAIALPPIRSYVHLHPDQLDSMTGGIAVLERVLRDVANQTT